MTFWKTLGSITKGDGLLYTVQGNGTAFRVLVTTPDHSRYLGETRYPTTEKAAEAVRAIA